MTKGSISVMELHGYIDHDKNGKSVINYDDQFFKNKIDSFKQKNENHRILVRFEVIDKPEYYLHKYYRGFLLPDLAKAIGEVDTNYVHIQMKKRFLYEKVEQLSEVPTRYRSRCNYFIEEKNGKSELVGYTPSTGDIPHQNMKDYIQKVEHVLFVDVGGCIDPRRQDVAKDYREKGFNIEIEQPQEQGEF